VGGPAYYDAIIIGSGQAGNPLAEAFASAGRRTALVEREHIRGTCVNVGCTPTKTMVASARVAYLARRAADYGVHTGPVSVDLAAVRQQKRNIVEEWREGKLRPLKLTEHLDLLMGEARFTGRRSIGVVLAGGGRRRLEADRARAVGSRPHHRAVSAPAADAAAPSSTTASSGSKRTTAEAPPVIARSAPPAAPAGYDGSVGSGRPSGGRASPVAQRSVTNTVPPGITSRRRSRSSGRRPCARKVPATARAAAPRGSPR
jgi:hypothetical protein